MEDKLEKLKKKNDLSDIILEKEGSSGDKIKKLLLGAASLVLLFLIVLIGMKMFNSSSVSPSEELASVGESISDKVETATDNVVHGAKKSLDDIDTATDDSLFKSEAIIDEESETDLKFEEMVRKLKQQDAKDNQNSEASVKEADKALDDVFDAKKEETPAPTSTKVAEESENVVDKIKDIADKPVQAVKEVTHTAKESIKSIPIPIAKSIPITKTEPTAAPIYVEETPKRVSTTRDTYTPPPPRHVTNTRTPTSPISSISGYFIQVGATAKSFPDRRFLQKIKNNGFDYIVHKVSIKGKNIKKVLVGPYPTRAAARAELSSVQSTVNPSAYIYRVK